MIQISPWAENEHRDIRFDGYAEFYASWRNKHVSVEVVGRPITIVDTMTVLLRTKLSPTFWDFNLGDVGLFLSGWRILDNDWYQVLTEIVKQKQAIGVLSVHDNMGGQYHGVKVRECVDRE